MPLPPQEIQAVRQQECSSQFAELRRQAEQNPRGVFLCAALMGKTAQREYLLRTAFLTAAAKDPEVAGQHLDKVVREPWAGSIGLYKAAQVARSAKGEAAEMLIRAAALGNPSMAIREYDLLMEFPFGEKLLEDVMLAIPGEAVAMASSGSRSGSRLAAAMDKSGNATLQAMGLLARSKDGDFPTRQRAAALVAWMPVNEALRAAGGDRTYFQALCAHAGTERQAEAFAMPYLREIRDSRSRLGEVRGWSGGELYRLMVYGRSELDDSLFRALFDIWKPKWNSASMESLPRLRAFLSDALTYGRFDGLPPTMLPQAMRGIPGIEEMLWAGEIVDAAAQPLLPKLAEALLGEPGLEGNPLYGLLAARLSERLPAHDGLRAAGGAYRRYLQAPASLPSAALFSHGNTSLHRYFFYDDDDGVLSYEAFRGSYAHAAGWRFEEKDGYAHVTGSAPNGRRIEIYANIPIDLSHAGNGNRGEESAERRLRVTRLLASLDREPDVIVHRGHAFHLEKTIRQLTPGARLVYLGSCRGMENVDAVIHGANGAQIIATRGTGSHTINDPLLKALNEQMLRPGDTLDWAQFWQAQRARLGGNPLFNDYIPPFRNTPAILLRAYYSYLASD